MQKRKAIVSLVVTAVLLFATIVQLQTTKQLDDTSTNYQVSESLTDFGPRDDLQILYYANDTAVYEALKAGEIDMSFWETTPAQYNDAINDPNIMLAPVSKLDFRAMSLNLNETITTYAGVKNPLAVPEFRKAIHRLSNRDYWVNTICGGFATKLPVTIAAPSSGWWNQSVVDFAEGNAPGRYPYPYDSLTFDTIAAAALLNAASFNDTDDPDTIRNYPADWPGRPGRPNLDPIVFVIRNDDSLRKAAGEHLADQMTSVGIPVNPLLMNFSTAYTRVISQRNYHIYTAGWSVGRFPTYLYSWFHSSRWYPGGSNYHLSTTPRYSDIDTLVDKVWYAPTYVDALQAAKDAQYLLTEKYTVMVPAWSSRSFYPYRNLLGVTNMQSTGPENSYTYLKAWKPDGDTIRAGLKSPPLQVNQIYSREVYDVSTMNPFMSDFLSIAPYNMMIDQPMLAQDWTSPPGTWLDGGISKSTMTYWFRDDPDDGLDDEDAEWIEPVTGNVLDDFAPQWLAGGGYEFNCWYYASEPAGWTYSGYRDIHHIRIYPAEKKAVVYFDVKSYWSMYWPYGRLIYSPVWKQAPLSNLVTKVFVEGVNATTPGFLTYSIPYRTVGAPVEIASVTIAPGTAEDPDGVLDESSESNDNDYEMVKGKIYVYEDVQPGTKMTVQYWARGDPAGYAPGGKYRSDNTRVGQVWVGTGTHYVTDHVPGVGGWTTYMRNPHYILETPPEAELDFWWYWNPGAQPRTGYYLVDISDIARAQFAVDGQGRRVPSPNWEPGADLVLDPYDPEDIALDPSLAGKMGPGKVTNLDYAIVAGLSPPDVAILDVVPSQNVVERGDSISIDVTAENHGEYSVPLYVTVYANTTGIQIKSISLDPWIPTIVSFDWNTTNFANGNYIISANASILPGEIYTEDNTYENGIVTVESKVSVHPTIIIGPPPRIGETFTVNITVSDVIDLYTWQAGMTFNASMLECLSIAEGEFLKKAGVPTLWTPGTINNTLGTISYSACSVTGTAHGVNGTGQLMNATFRVKDNGISALHLTDVLLLDSNLDPIIPVTLVDGHVEIHLQDIAVLSVITSDIEAYPTWVVQIDITVAVENQGTKTETFDVTVYANTLAIETKSVTLAAGANTTLVYNWNLAGVAEDTYTIRAEATILYGEIDTADNTRTDGIVKIKHPGDANDDGVLNAYDLGILAKAWTASGGTYDPRADFNGDGTINTLDHDILKAYWP